MDELNLFDLPQKSSDDSDYSANRAVGCCGRYIACSAAGHCVNQNSGTAASCLYIVNSGDLKKEPPSISEEDQQLLHVVHALDTRDQGKVLGYAESLLSAEKYSAKDASKHA